MRPGEFIRVMAAIQWLGGRPAVCDYLAWRRIQLRQERDARALAPVVMSDEKEAA